MFRLLNYYGQWQGFRGRMSQLPSWARLLITLAALPGIVLIALSILAFLVSLLALLLLTVPAYSLLRRLTGGSPAVQTPVAANPFGVTFGPPVDVPSGTKRVDSTVVE